MRLALPLPQARPKYVLRKLAFSIMPEGSDNRDRFVAVDLNLGSDICTQQRRCVKDGLVAILTAVCDRMPALARIPEAFCHKL